MRARTTGRWFRGDTRWRLGRRRAIFVRRGRLRSRGKGWGSKRVVRKRRSDSIYHKWICRIDCMAIVLRAGVKGKVCSTCRSWKPLSDYYPDRTHGPTQGGRHCRCKDCHSRKGTERRAALKVKEESSFGSYAKFVRLMSKVPAVEPPEYDHL